MRFHLQLAALQHGGTVVQLGGATSASLPAPAAKNQTWVAKDAVTAGVGRSSTFQLNLSRFHHSLTDATQRIPRKACNVELKSGRVATPLGDGDRERRAAGRGLHSSAFQLNLSRFCR